MLEFVAYCHNGELLGAPSYRGVRLSLGRRRVGAALKQKSDRVISFNDIRKVEVQR